MIHEHKNAPRPVPGELSPVPGRKRFLFQVVVLQPYMHMVMQVVSEEGAAHELQRNKQENKKIYACRFVNDVLQRSEKKKESV